MQQPHGPKVHRITDADESRSADMHSRMVKYTISMSVRLACFIAAFIFDGWLRWALFAGAAVLPYIAVVLANGGADHSKRGEASWMNDGGPRNSLGPAGSSTAADPANPDTPDGSGASAGPAEDSPLREEDDPVEGIVLEGLLLEDLEENPHKPHRGQQHGPHGPAAADGGAA
ncbi:DUF3099 domain-containing protein [Paeniglutamicibacter cryotolerans]|uniref:DUF3099 domain-containing protein n=1 Tax=Paeniglutamicibacter cryotolerans TaxID=670079 RepID=A0A839QM45_9MICC|nr:DUF3099 domain-containing protein [Paeniglutamicibacter cryotolerans]MBB2997309.1 hypothetical protein [Paeniglutamicibacter cryotolerans]